MKRHRFDPGTPYCIACGTALSAILETRETNCPGGGNVVAISHLVRGKRLQQLIETVVSFPEFAQARHDRLRQERMVSFSRVEDPTSWDPPCDTEPPEVA